jgi:hypothetical protein
MQRKAEERSQMTELDEITVLAHAKALAAQEGYTWELDFFSASGQQRAPVRGQHFLSKDRQEEYLERAREELRKEAGNNQTPA